MAGVPDSSTGTSFSSSPTIHLLVWLSAPAMMLVTNSIICITLMFPVAEQGKTGKSSRAAIAFVIPSLNSISDNSPFSRYLSISSSLLSAIISISCSRAVATSSTISAGTSETSNFPLSSLYRYALPSRRSTIPEKLPSLPIGSATGTASRAIFFWMPSRHFSKSDRSRSSLLTMKIPGLFSSVAIFHAFSVCTSTPETPQTMNAIASLTRKDPLDSGKKLPYPGVSSTFTFFLLNSK